MVKIKTNRRIRYALDKAASGDSPVAEAYKHYKKNRASFSKGTSWPSKSNKRLYTKI